MLVIGAAVLERLRKKAVKARGQADRHPYFHGVAEARYTLRKVFRLVEEEAKNAGIDPLAHQALIQIYGSKNSALRVREVADRLDIAPPFSSSLIKLLVEKGYVRRKPDSSDQRVTWVAVSAAGREVLHRIDERVQLRVDHFAGTLSRADREAVLSILLFYVGVSLQPGHKRSRRN